jgi:hypothetical protein
MGLLLALVGLALSLIEFVGWGLWLESRVDRIRVRSMQIALRNGEINPKLSELYGAMIGSSMLGFLGLSLLVTALLLPILLIFGQSAAENAMVNSSIAYPLALGVLGSMALTVGLAAAYLIWCTVVTGFASLLNWMNSLGKTYSVTFGVGLGIVGVLVEVMSKSKQ